MLRELNESESAEILLNNSVGRLGCTDGENVYIVPINYTYEQGAILCYSLEGLKIDLMRKHPSVCFEVDEILDQYHWKCVVVNGVFEEITDKAELDRLRPRYSEYFLRKRTSIPASPEADQQNEETQESTSRNTERVFYRIRFNKVSGRLDSGFD
jgi:nitroimidazol reductase NimA-like FMN-containing flavoprotein (pyridoxamine 5'-phosphate oxidase superfamily)